jgi:hypothetical protein
MVGCARSGAGCGEDDISYEMTQWALISSILAVVSLAEDFSAAGFAVVALETSVFERLSLFSALSASGERARFLDFLSDELVALVDQLAIFFGGALPP